MHNNNIINLLKLEGVKFINLEEQGLITDRPCECKGYTTLLKFLGNK